LFLAPEPAHPVLVAPCIPEIWPHSGLERTVHLRVPGVFAEAPALGAA
jgi:hypothetical protein